MILSFILERKSTMSRRQLNFIKAVRPPESSNMTWVCLLTSPDGGQAISIGETHWPEIFCWNSPPDAPTQSGSCPLVVSRSLPCNSPLVPNSRWNRDVLGMLQLKFNLWMSSLQRNQGKLLISIAVVNEGILCSSFFLQTVKEGEYWPCRYFHHKVSNKSIAF